MIDLGTLGGQNSSVGNPTTNVKGLIVGNAQTGDADPTGDCTVNPSTGEPTGECWGTGFGCPAAIPCQGYQNLVRGFVWRDGAMSAAHAWRQQQRGVRRQQLGTDRRLG
jgi:hypothetical protein